MNVLAGCAVAGVLLLLAWLASHFHREPRLLPVVCAFALGAAVQGLENVGVVQFRKELRFDKEFRYLLTKKLIGFVVAAPNSSRQSTGRSCRYMSSSRPRSAEPICP